MITKLLTITGIYVAPFAIIVTRHLEITQKVTFGNVFLILSGILGIMAYRKINNAAKSLENGYTKTSYNAAKTGILLTLIYYFLQSIAINFSEIAGTISLIGASVGIGYIFDYLHIYRKNKVTTNEI